MMCGNSSERKHDLVALGRTQAAWVDAPRFAIRPDQCAHTYALSTKETRKWSFMRGLQQRDGAESDPDAAIREIPGRTKPALACNVLMPTFVHISTAYVFDYGTELCRPAIAS